LHHHKFTLIKLYFRRVILRLHKSQKKGLTNTVESTTIYIFYWLDKT